ncbi:MAG: polysaccharide deacetylase family protein [bacterium]
MFQRLKKLWVALVLAAGWFGAGGAVAGVAPAFVPPGGLAPSNTPQIILLTFDDSVTSNSLRLVQGILTNHVNPNGDQIKATFFVSLDAVVDYGCVNKLYAAGHEISVHTMTHSTSTNTGLATWRQEIVGCRKALSQYAAIPLDDIVGFRAPYLKFNNAMFQLLGERGFRYDSSLLEWPGSASTNAANYLWPYTLEGGVVQSNSTGAFLIDPVPGLFEIPLWNQVTSGVSAASMDPPDSMDSNTVSALWKTNFLLHYDGNRAPYGIYLHATTTNQWLSKTNTQWRSDVLNEFIEWAQDHTNVWFLTMRDLADFMLSPVSSDQALTATMFQTTTGTPSAVAFCRNVGLNVCGDCPPARPRPTSVYCEAAPISGGVLTMAVTTNSSWLEYHLAYTNDTTEAAEDWEAVFEFSTNYVFGSAQSSTALMETNGGMIRMTLWPKAYRLPLVAGATETSVYFSVKGHTSTNVQLVSISLAGLRPIRPQILGFSAASSGVFEVVWDDSAYGYSPEVSTNLVANAWWSATNQTLYGATNWAWSPSGAATNAFLRIRGVP